MAATKRTFKELVARLEEIFDEDDNTADIDDIKEAMDSYTSCEADWEEYAHWDDHKYTRNLVSTGKKGKYNLMMLCWNLGQHSSIHDHAGAHCFMKILDGSLHEELYNMPQPGDEGGPMEPCRVTELPTNGMAYISDKIGLHRISNQSHTIPAVSLHLYSPPYEECHSFDELSGASRASGKMTFYSRGGVKVPAEQR